MNSALPIRCSQVGEVRPLSCPSGHIGTETLGLPEVAIGVHPKVPSLGTERQLQEWQCPWVMDGRRALRGRWLPRSWFCRIWESCLKGQSRFPSSGSFNHLTGQPTPVFLPGESQGWGAWRATVHRVAESDTTEHTHTHTALYGLPFCFSQEHLPFLALSPRPQDRKLTDENPGSCQPPSEQWEDSWAG